MRSLLHALPAAASLVTAAAAAAAAAAATAAIPCTTAVLVDARLPPSLNPAVNSSPPAWTAPPTGWFYGNWRITYSSNRGYVNLTNLQFDSSPILPSCSGSDPSACPPGTFPGQNVDLQTWASPSDPSGLSMMSAFGYDTPRRTSFPSLGSGWDTTFDFRGTGPLLNTTNTWEMLAWGYDELGDGYFVAYETSVSNGGAPPDLDIESRSSTGPAPLTLAAIHSALLGLGSDNVTQLLGQLQQLPRNSVENDVPPFVCGPACQNNSDLNIPHRPSSHSARALLT